MPDALAFKKHNVRGGVTYSQFNMAQAIANNERSTFPKKDDRIAPQVQLLLDQTQLDKFIAHLRDVFVPECVARGGRGEKKDILTDGQAKKILKALEERGQEEVPWQSQSPFLPIAQVYKKTKENPAAGYAVATLKFTGTAGMDIERLARVNGESELRVPDPNVLIFPVLKPIDQTVHDLYPGAWAYATLNLSAYTSSPSNFGISAYSNTLVFLEDRDRLAGGASLDEDDIFMDE